MRLRAGRLWQLGSLKRDVERGWMQLEEAQGERDEAKSRLALKEIEGRALAAQASDPAQIRPDTRTAPVRVPHCTLPSFSR